MHSDGQELGSSGGTAVPRGKAQRQGGTKPQAVAAATGSQSKAEVKGSRSNGLPSRQGSHPAVAASTAAAAAALLAGAAEKPTVFKFDFPLGQEKVEKATASKPPLQAEKTSKPAAGSAQQQAAPTAVAGATSSGPAVEVPAAEAAGGGTAASLQRDALGSGAAPADAAGGMWSIAAAANGRHQAGRKSLMAALVAHPLLSRGAAFFGQPVAGPGNGHGPSSMAATPFSVQQREALSADYKKQRREALKQARPKLGGSKKRAAV